MAGHQDSIIAFGKNFEDAFDVLMRVRKGSSPCIKNGFHERIPSRDEG